MTESRAAFARPDFGLDTVVFGIGNCARSDDGLGWAFLDAAKQRPGFQARPEYRYQLQVEDALLVSQMKHVVFVDSSRTELPGGFGWEACRAAADFEFTTHVLPPRAILHYCRTLYGREPRSHVLQIQGYRWDLGHGMSAAARENLVRALAFFSA